MAHIHGVLDWNSQNLRLIRRVCLAFWWRLLLSLLKCCFALLFFFASLYLIFSFRSLQELHSDDIELELLPDNGRFFFQSWIFFFPLFIRLLG